jgi:LCP family protein required for cell wall assembly
MKQIIILCLLLTLLASSCSIFSVDPTPSPLPTNTKTSTPIPSPTDTQTPSPTPPKTPTPTYTTIPSVTPTSPYVWGYFPGPTEDSAIDISPPVDPIPFSADTVNIILLGSDRRPNIAGYRTDTLLILSLDLEKNTATMLSIPRDLYVFIPGWKVNRINTAEPRGGFEMISDTILYNLGIPLHHWVRVRFEGMIEAIDIMGGIDVITTGPLYDECGGVYYRYDTGNVYHMDGMDALCYTRMRKTSSDFDRLRRQQEVLEAMFSKVISIIKLVGIASIRQWSRASVSQAVGLPFSSPSTMRSASCSSWVSGVRGRRFLATYKCCAPTPLPIGAKHSA